MARAPAAALAASTEPVVPATGEGSSRCTGSRCQPGSCPIPRLPLPGTRQSRARGNEVRAAEVGDGKGNVEAGVLARRHARRRRR